MREQIIQIRNPAWVDESIDWKRLYTSDDQKMALVIELSHRNIQNAGEPFGAAIFRCDTQQIISVAVSQVVRSHNSILHAEVVAIMLAEARLQVYNLRVEGFPYELITSCEPCAMCLGAAHWSGVTRIVCGAARDDAHGIGFDEGPVFPQSYAYLEERGVEIVRGVRRAEARDVIRAYLHTGGLIHNRVVKP